MAQNVALSLKLRHWGSWAIAALIAICLVALPWMTAPAIAGLTDDKYDGNIFALYAGNGSLVPPKVKLAQSIKVHKPALVVFYVDDSADCKQFTSVISQLQEPYGRAANFIPIMADSILSGREFTPMEVGYYFEGSVPQTLVFDDEGNVVFNQPGNVSYEAVDDVMRDVFDLLPRSESVELKRRPVNEVNSELVN
ncbi:MAG: thylakoid membrane photosystem I accumulation factor [Cyanobacteria bacterium P01_A01_bin.123]